MMDQKRLRLSEKEILAEIQASRKEAEVRAVKKRQ